MGNCIHENYLGKTGNASKFVSSGAVAVDSSAYASGDALTDGYLTFDCAAQHNGWGAILAGLEYKVNNNGAAATTAAPSGKLYLFDTIPTSQTKNDALSFDSDDLSYLVGMVTITAGTIIGNFAYKDHVVADVLSLMTAVNNNSLYGIFVADAAKTFNSGATIEFILKLLQD